MEQASREILFETISAEIKSARRRLGLSQAELARMVKLTQAHVSGIENGRVIPRFDTLVEIVRALEMDLVLVPRSISFIVKYMAKNKREGRELFPNEPMYGDMETEEEEEGPPDFGR